jgi:subtilase family serine protease
MGPKGAARKERGLVSVKSAYHKVQARLAAVVLAVPLVLAVPAPAIAAHPMTPAVGGLANYLAIGDMQDLGAVHFPCQVPGSHFPPCYGPDQIKAAYDIQPLLDSGINGSGRTIVIVDAFSDPFLQGDVALYNAVWGLPATNLTVVAPDGLTPFDGSPLQMGWAIEISLDVEWAHVVAPGANLVLVLSKTQTDADMLSATEYAIDNDLGDVITMSFGESENCADPALLREEHAAFERAASRGMTLVSGSGDFGATNLLCDGSGIQSVASATTPGSDPDVTSVGATRLMAGLGSGAYMGETAWNDPVGASGGGFSAVYHRPGYQAPFIDDNSARGVPDVAYSGDIIGGAIIAFGGHFGALSGTSVGTPQWAGIAALTAQASGHRGPQLNIRLYHLAKSRAYAAGFHDIRSGNNSFAGVNGFSAGEGWDPVTGLGSPDVAQLVPLLS